MAGAKDERWDASKKSVAVDIWWSLFFISYFSELRAHLLYILIIERLNRLKTYNGTSEFVGQKLQKYYIKVYNAIF